MRCNIYRLLIGSEIQFGQLLVNCVSSGFPMPPTHGMCFFQFRLCHMACVEFTRVALLCSHYTCLIGVDVNEAGYRRERGLHL